MRFRWRNSLVKNLFRIIILILVPISILNIFFMIYWNNYLTRQEIETDTKFLALTGRTLDTILNDINQVVSLLEFDRVLNAAMLGLIDADGQLAPEKFIDINSIWDNTSRVLLSKPYIRSAYFYLESSRKFVFTISGIQNLQNMTDKSWLDSYNHSGDKSYWAEVRTVRYPNNQQTSTLTLFRKIPILSGREKGVIVIDLESKYFDTLIANIPRNESKKIFILDEKNTVIYQNTAEPLVKYLKTPELPGLSALDNYMVKKIGRMKFLIAATQSNYYHWTYISIIPFRILLNKLDFIKKLNIIVYIVALMIGIGLAYFYSFKNYQPIRTMIEIITHYNAGKDISNFQFRHDDDYGYVIYNLIKSLIEKSQIQKRLTEEVLLQKETQLYALQSQINPHFLYNTLETVNWEAIECLGSGNTISRILVALADNLRYAINCSDQLVAVQEDLDHLKSYISMHETINHGRIAFQFNIETAVASHKILRLLIQPLVENAIIHGLSDIQQGGIVKLTARQRGAGIQFRVSDNGCGISRAQLAQIRAELGKTGVLVKNMGLNNINQRVKLKFGEAYGIRLRSKINYGTVVTIQIPVVI